MNVYVESNFVLEQAFEQEQCESCDRLIEISREGRIRIVIPAFSLAESHIALMRKGSERARFVSELQRQLAELARSKSFQNDLATVTGLLAPLLQSRDRERARLEQAVHALIETADIIPLTADVLRDATGFQAMLDLSFQDSVVLGSVLRHLRRTAPAESCFLNRNTADFANPKVRDLLEHQRCRFFGRFDDALGYTEAWLRQR